MSSKRYPIPLAHGLVLLLTIGIGGCNTNSNLAPVRGVVRLEGKPVAGAAVAFRPEEGGRPAWAITEEDGTYELTTLHQGDGARIGKHVVTVTCVEEDSGTSATAQADDERASIHEADVGRKRRKWIVPERFSNVKTSGLTCQVHVGEKNVANFILEE